MAKILIVDDSPTVREIIMRGIRQAGLKVAEFEEAADGVEGLAALEGGAVDLILSDVHMPNMNGLDFVSNVRAQHGEDTPIVMMTNEGHDELVCEAKTRGASGHIEKPFSPERIQEVLGDHLA